MTARFLQGPTPDGPSSMLRVFRCISRPRAVSICSVYTLRSTGDGCDSSFKACLLTQYFRACHQVFPRPPRDQDQGPSIMEDADEIPE